MATMNNFDAFHDSFKWKLTCFIWWEFLVNDVFYTVSSHSTGSYDIAEAEGVQRGTKIVLHLKGDSYNFAKEDRIKGLYQMSMKIRYQ